MLRSLETSESVARVKIAAKSGDFGERGDNMLRSLETSQSVDVGQDCPKLEDFAKR